MNLDNFALMIQRIQTLYLALIAALSFTVASVKLYELAPGETAKGSSSYLATVWNIVCVDKGNTTVISSNPSLGLILVLIGIVALITAWMYKARKKQMTLCKVMLLLSLAWVGLFLSGINTLRTLTGAGFQFRLYPFTAAIVLIPLLIVFALRGIKKDDELVRSADRLR